MSNPTNDAKPAKEAGSSFLAEIRGSATNAAEGTTPVRAGRRISSSYVVAAVMTVLSAGALFGMRSYGKNAGLSIEKFDADFKPSKSETATAAQTQKILADLEAHGTPIQISASAIPRNPFLMSAATPVVVTQDPSGKANLEADRKAREAAERDRRTKELATTDALRGLEVTGVIMGQRPVARVSGKLYRAGDTISKLFVVLEITERGVKLGYEGREFEVAMKTTLNSDGSKPEEDPANNSLPRHR